LNRVTLHGVCAKETLRGAPFGMIDNY